jgi:sigma-B regulation protein RsbU (phosphoserine phosphatase)
MSGDLPKETQPSAGAGGYSQNAVEQARTLANCNNQVDGPELGARKWLKINVARFWHFSCRAMQTHSGHETIEQEGYYMPKQLRVLMVEDSEDDMFFALQELKRGDFQPEYERVDTLSRLTAALDRQVWDVILCDHAMQGFTSFHALELLKRRQYDIPFIILSGVIGEDVAVQAMKAGANDYVMKNALGRLVPSVEREVREAANRRVGRQAEKALRRSQYDLNDFFEHAPFGLHWAGPDGLIMRVNGAELEMLGYGPPEYLGHNLQQFFVDPGEAEDLLQRLRDGKVIEDYESQLRGKDGTIKEAGINANALWDDGKFIRSRWFVRDITDRKKYERAVAFLGAIVESSEEAIIGTDLKANILSWNQGATLMYGFTAEEAKGRSIGFLIPSSSPGEPLNSYLQILEGKTVDRQEGMRLCKDGATIPVSFTRSPVKDSQGRIIGISAIERDISAQRLEEGEWLHLNQELSRSLANVKTLRGLLPICASCKKIRDDQGYWNQLESYIAEHTLAEFTHGICPECQAHLHSEIETRLAGKD